LEPLQILVLNLFADGMAAVALSLEKGEKGIMNDSPRPKKQQIIHGRLWVVVLTNALWIALGALAIFVIGLYWNFGSILLNDILTDASKIKNGNIFKDVVCSRWQGSGNGWKQYGNCEATFSNGTFKFVDDGNAPFVDQYESDTLYCRTGQYECVSEGIARSQTMIFVYITTMEMFRAYTARSFTNHVFRNFFTNKYMQLAAIGSITLTLSVTNIPVVMDKLFGFAYIDWYQWLLSMMTAIIMVFLSEMIKCGYRTNDRKKTRWNNIDRGFDHMLVEIRNLRHHVERLESHLEQCNPNNRSISSPRNHLALPRSPPPTSHPVFTTHGAPSLTSNSSSSSSSSSSSILEETARQEDISISIPNNN
jgi:magnesium-transporting ATPase (P-type)